MSRKKDEIIKIHQEREELVVKSNELIRNTRYSLSEMQQKIVIYLISKICAQDTYIKHVKFSLAEYCDLIGIRRNNNREYKYIQKSIQDLRNKSWWFELSDKSVLFSWVDYAEIDKNTGIIDIALSDSLKPFLLDIKGNFTKYELINILVLKSKYSIRLYELFKSYLWLGKWEVDVDLFRELVNVGEKYSDWTEFKRNVITPSIKEITKYTDLEIKMEIRKQGREIRTLIFNITEKRGVQLTLDLILNQEERLAIR